MGQKEREDRHLERKLNKAGRRDDRRLARQELGRFLKDYPGFTLGAAAFMGMSGIYLESRNPAAGLSIIPITIILNIFGEINSESNLHQQHINPIIDWWKKRSGA